MEQLITLDEAKEMLGYDTSDKDTTLTAFILGASQAILNYIDEKHRTEPPAVCGAACRLMIRMWDDNEIEQSDRHYLPDCIVSILHDYRTPTAV